jgi:hypothetical protein
MKISIETAQFPFDQDFVTKTIDIITDEINHPNLLNSYFSLRFQHQID